MPVTHVPVSVPDATTYTVLARNSGLVHFMPNLSSSCTVTLPAPKAGLWFEFAYSASVADAQNWVISTGSDTNYYIGGLLSSSITTPTLWRRSRLTATRTRS